MRRIRFIARKELYHILRDPRSLTIVLIMPIMMTFLYGYAINLDVENVVLAVIDYDRTDESRELIDRFYHSTYFSPPSRQVDPTRPENILRSSEAHSVLVITAGFGEALQRRQEFSLGMYIDGSDNTTAAAVQSYSQALLGEMLAEGMLSDRSRSGISIAPRILYNPDLESAVFFVPGLVALILIMISALLTSITIAREKETGTMEQLLTAPITPLQILVGKVLPYILIALIDGLSILILARLLFDVPFVGSHVLLLAFGLVYIITSLCMGIFISTLVKTQQVAMMSAQLATLLPSVMISGFLFSIKNMPQVLQWLSYVVPARYFVTVIRGIMLKGAGWDVLVWQGLGLLVLMFVMLTIATRKFTTRVV